MSSAFLLIIKSPLNFPPGTHGLFHEFLGLPVAAEHFYVLIVGGGGKDEALNVPALEEPRHVGMDASHAPSGR